MSWCELISNVILSLITGLLSGWIVSDYFRRKQQMEEWLRNFNEQKQLLSKFIGAISEEIDFIIQLKKENMNINIEEINELKRLISQKRPKHDTFKFLTAESKKDINEIVNYIDHLYEELTNDVSLVQLYKYKKVLAKYRWKVLRFKQCKY